jgi:hypothetical protein
MTAMGRGREPAPRKEQHVSIPSSAQLDIAEILDGELACSDEFYPDWQEDEYRLWLEQQDDAAADQQDGDRCPECWSIEPCECLVEDDPVIGNCDVCGDLIRADQLERTTSHQQRNGCDVDLAWYRCHCGAMVVD